MAVTIHWTGLQDWNTGLDYWTEFFSFLGKNLYLFLERNLHFYNQRVARWLLWMIVD